MIAPSINPVRQKNCGPIWVGVPLHEVCGMLEIDVDELRRLYHLQAEDAAEAVVVGRQPDYRLRTLIEAWERIQDVHWSWYKEILNANTGATQGLASLG